MFEKNTKEVEEGNNGKDEGILPLALRAVVDILNARSEAMGVQAIVDVVNAWFFDEIKAASACPNGPAAIYPDKVICIGAGEGLLKIIHDEL